MFAITYSLLWVVAVAQTLAICFLVRQIQEIRERGFINPMAKLELARGSKPPLFSAMDARTGKRIKSSAVLRPDSVLLLLAPECGTCRAVISELSTLTFPVASNLIILCQGTIRRCQQQFTARDFPASVLIGDGRDFASDFQVRTLPAIVTLDAKARIASYRYPTTASDVQQYAGTSFSTTSKVVGANLGSHVETARVASGTQR